MALDNVILEHHDFPESQYYQTEYPKKQIVLHHTVSGMGVKGDINWWKMTEARVATWCFIDHAGIVHRIFSSRHWAHHLYVHSPGNKIPEKYKKGSINSKLNRESIGIELDSIGPLCMNSADGFWYDAYDRKYEGNMTVYEDGYRGYEAYASYTDLQIETLRTVLLYLSEEYDIPLTYFPQMWDWCCEERCL